MASPRIEIEETSLEELLLLGDDKLINIQIEYPTENGKVQAKAKIKQLTMKELKNMDLQRPSFETNIQILTKALYKQDGTNFTEEMILKLPVGVVNAISEQILRTSGVDKDMGF